MPIEKDQKLTSVGGYKNLVEIKKGSTHNAFTINKKKNKLNIF